MNKYVVSHMDFFENELKSEVVEANSYTDAVKASSFDLAWVFEDTDSLEKAKEYAFNSDTVFEVILVA